MRERAGQPTNQGVGGSNLSGRAFEATGFMIKEAQIVVHKAHQPDVLLDLPDAGVPANEGATWIDPSTTDADAAACGRASIGERRSAGGLLPCLSPYSAGGVR